MWHINTAVYKYATFLDLYTISLTTQSIIFTLFTVTLELHTSTHRYFSSNKTRVLSISVRHRFAYSNTYRFIMFNRILEWFRLEETLKIICVQPLYHGEGCQFTRSGCSGFHSSCPWTFPEMEQPQHLWAIWSSPLPH